MVTTKEQLEVTEKQLEKIIWDFLDHLKASGSVVVDEEDGHKLDEAGVIENYFGTFN